VVESTIVPLREYQDHGTCYVINGEAGRETEKFTGFVDQYWKDRDELLKDELEYPRWLPGGPPHGPSTQMKDLPSGILL
jgi:hypothetical protein